LIDAQDTEPTQADRVISVVLRAGVGTSFTLIMLGMFFGLVAHDSPMRTHTPIDEVLHTSVPLSSIAGLISALRDWRPDALVMLGLLVLIATPMFRVAASILIFIQQRSPAFVAITTFVLTLLLGSMFLGRAGG
jgi:uncharacterized membrane protein